MSILRMMKPTPTCENRLTVLSRRKFLKASASTTAFWLTQTALSAEKAEPTSSDADLLAHARERIETHRKGDGGVVVRNANGKPVPNATLKIEQIRHEFLFGCNSFMFGRIKDSKSEEKYRRQFAALLNYATLGFYWAYYEPDRGKPIYDYTDKVADWCRTHGITCKGHPLVWDYADPKWLPQDFAEIRALSNARVRKIVERYKGRINIWDAVNEPTHLGRFNTRTGQWAMSMGAVPYTAEHLKIAHAANPKAKLLVNDYRTDPPYQKILEGLRENGKLLFDAIGIQSHMHGGPWPLGKIWDVCDTYAKFGVPIHFTETTVVSGPRAANRNWASTTPEGEAAQAEYVPKFYTMLYGHPAVQALTWWDFADEGAWQWAPAGWLRKDMSPKPVYERLIKLIKGEWWTQAEGRTNGNGEVPISAFYGTHLVTVQLTNGRSVTKEIEWKCGQANRYEISIT